MMTERRSLRFFAALFLLIFAPLLWADDKTDSGSIRLFWNEDRYALHYEVIVEIEDENGEYRKLMRDFTDTYSIVISLAPGKYRFCVVPYDFLEQSGEASQWLDFEIQAPYVPPEPESFVAEPVVREQVVRGDYQAQPYLLKNPNLFGVYLNAAWMPMLPVYRGEPNPFFGRDMSLAGALVRFGVMYAKEAFLNPGLEFSGTWYAFKPASKAPARHAVTAGLNVLARKLFPGRRMALSLRAGAGLSFLPGSEEKTALTRSFHANIDVSFLLFAADRFFMETGLDYVHLFLPEPSGCLRPWLGIGWQFWDN